ncbi:MAG TPA: glycoside hydrolase [Chloroflexi bacterium]|nr:glycoside hydrolase [Chloroflexota bacterium]
MESSLYEHSISVILNNQHSSGAYVASPSFAPYRYSWFRDGAFIAYAMDLAGEHESARRFHEWAGRTILRYESKISRCIENAHRGIPPTEKDCFHCRFTVEGMEGDDEWANHQLDGLGTWLWAMIQHLKMSGFSAMPESWQRAVALVRRYLTALWPFPCFDCWEENGERLHTYTLAAIYGGLQAAADLWGDQRARETAEEIRSFVLENAVQEGHLVKFVGSREIDANLLGVATPYRLLSAEESLMRSTVGRIEKELRSPGGGLHRYQRDTYYGGGEWILLTAWLGWYYVDTGQLERAQGIKAWVETQATPEGDLPEQVPVNLNDPSYYPVWLERFGTIATPLLWSHAEYLILCEALQARLTGSTLKGPQS